VHTCYKQDKKTAQHRQMLRIFRKLKTKANGINNNSERTFKMSVAFILKKRRKGTDKRPDILNCKCQASGSKKKTGYIKRQMPAFSRTYA
jgi:hypothetical protein